MGRHANKRQVVVYLPDRVHRRLKARAAREGVSMSTVVERALENETAPVLSRPMLDVSDAGEELPPAATALVRHGAPLIGRGHSAASLEEAVAVGTRESRKVPALLRALIVVLAKHREVRWDYVRARLRDDELQALGAVADLAGVACDEPHHAAFADALFQEVGAVTPPQPFFTGSRLATAYTKLPDRTPAPMRRWGFVIGTPLSDFEQAVRKFA